MKNNIAVIYNKNQPDFIKNILQKENMGFSVLKTNDVINNILLLDKYGIIFINLDNEIRDALTLINKIKHFSNDKLIIATSSKPNDINIRKAIFSGVNDFIRHDIDRNSFLKRLRYYKEILNNYHRERLPYYIFLKSENDKAYNLFTDSILARVIKFNIEKKNDLFKAWNYLINYADSENNFRNLELLFSILEWMLANSFKSFLICEEGKEAYYVTAKCDPIPDKVVNRLAMRYCNYDNLKIQNGIVTIKLDKQTKQKNNQTMNRVVNAKDFLAITPLEISTKIDELEELEDILTMEVNNLELSKSTKTTNSISELFKKYAETVFLLDEFVELAKAIDKIANIIGNIDENLLKNDETTNLFTSLLYSLIDDLNKWRISIFVNQEARDIHYLDESMIASCSQIERLLSGDLSSEEDNEGDVEFF